MEKKVPKLAILNLTSELPQELADYFVSRQIKVVSPLENKENLQWTHILTKGVDDFSLLRKTYETVQNDIKVISLDQVSDPQDFIMANGKLVLDGIWMKGVLGSFILDKFFQEYSGITLGDNYPSFEEKGSFNISNPFSTGDYLDRMVHHAFSDGFAALSVKTYFDHLIMFLTGLKRKGKVGLPIEVTYGMHGDIFGLQLHFFAEGLMLDDITGCLSNVISRNAEEHLLNVSINSTDFFDFTFLSQVQKAVITGLWSKDEGIKAENRGLMFTNLSSSAGISNFPYEGLTSQLMQSSPVDDLTDKVVLPDHPVTGVVPEVSGQDLAESLAEKISSGMDMQHLDEILNGEVVEEDNGKIVLNSTDEMRELVNIVKGSVEQETEVVRVKGGKLDVDNFAYKISASISDKAKEKGVFNVMSLGEKIPETIKTGLFDFARRIGKEAGDLSETDLRTFKDVEVPKIIKSETIVGHGLSKKLREEVKAKFEQNLKSEFMEESVDLLLESIKTPEEEMRVKQLLKSTIKSTLDSHFQLSHKDSISEDEKDILVKTLSSSLAEKEEKIRQIVSSEAAKEEVKPLFTSPPSKNEHKLQVQMQALQVENDGLKNKMKTLASEVKILKESRLQMAQVQADAKKAAAGAPSIPKSDQDDQLRKHFQQKLAQDEALNQAEQKKLSALLEREAKLIEAARTEEMKSRRLQIESGQKETFYLQEIEKANRQAKTRDLMLMKTKEALQKLSDKKEGEISGLKMKLDQLSMALSSGPTQAQTAQIRDLEKQNQNMLKMVEMYKAKLAETMTKLQSDKSGDGNSKEEVRRLQMINNQFKNQLDLAKRDVMKFQEKIAYDITQMTVLRADKTKLEQQLKKAGQDLKKDQSGPQNKEYEVELKKSQLQIQTLENQLKEVTIKFKDNETRLADVLKAGPKIAANEDSKRVSHLEANVKKLTQDLIESRNQANELKKETNKLRQEKTSMQNQMDKIKKDTEKATKAAPKKPESGNGGGKAA